MLAARHEHGDDNADGCAYHDALSTSLALGCDAVGQEPLRVAGATHLVAVKVKPLTRCAGARARVCVCPPPLVEQ